MSFFNSFFSVQSLDIHRLLWLEFLLTNMSHNCNCLWCFITSERLRSQRCAVQAFALLSWSNQCWWSVKRDANLGQWVCKCTAGIFAVPKCIIQGVWVSPRIRFSMEEWAELINTRQFIDHFQSQWPTSNLEHSNTCLLDKLWKWK